MDDLKARYKALMREIKVDYLEGKWKDRLLAVGVEEEDARKCIAEIGLVVAEYEHNLVKLMEEFEQDDLTSLPERLEDWVVYTYNTTRKKVKDLGEVLKDFFDKYVPDDDEEGDEE